MSKIFAPFTEDQVSKLAEWQSGAIPGIDWIGSPAPFPVHPLTCIPVESSKCLNNGILLATAEGLSCQCGMYKQNWCPDFIMIET